jgi:hypothetical protein
MALHDEKKKFINKYENEENKEKERKKERGRMKKLKYFLKSLQKR